MDCGCRVAAAEELGDAMCRAEYWVCLLEAEGGGGGGDVGWLLLWG